MLSQISNRANDPIEEVRAQIERSFQDSVKSQFSSDQMPSQAQMNESYIFRFSLAVPMNPEQIQALSNYLKKIEVEIANRPLENTRHSGMAMVHMRPTQVDSLEEGKTITITAELFHSHFYRQPKTVKRFCVIF